MASRHSSELREVAACPGRACWAVLRLSVSSAGAADADDLELVVRGLVQLDLVDHRVEPLVVGAQRLEDLPDDLCTLVVAERLLGSHAGRDADRQDDVAVLLARRLAHDPADGLDDVDDGLARVEEHHRVQGGDVDALGQAAGVGQDAAGVPGRSAP